MPVGAAKLVNLGAAAALLTKELPKTDPPKPLGLVAAPFAAKPNPDGPADAAAEVKNGDGELPKALVVAFCGLCGSSAVLLAVPVLSDLRGDVDLNTEEVEEPSVPNGDLDEFAKAANPEEAKLVGAF